MRRGYPESFGFSAIVKRVYFIVEPENILALWKLSYSLPRLTTQIMCLEMLFKMPQKALAIYKADDSGTNHAARPGSQVSPENRIHYLTHESLASFLNGTGLQVFYQRWARCFTRYLDDLELSDDWVEFPDLMAFFDQKFGSANIEAICGPLLMELFPDFASDLAVYNSYVPDLLKRLPRWACLKAYRSQDRVYDCIRHWHDVARARFDPNLVSPVDRSDPFWGSSFIRNRQTVFQDVKDFDRDAHTASDLGFIWGSYTNIVPTTMWAALEVFKDRTLLSRVREEVEDCRAGVNMSTFMENPQELFKSPLLMSIFSENLRFRTKGFVIRYANSTDITLGKWCVPSKSIMIVSTAQAMMNSQAWNEGKNNEHPTTTFWADRFLLDPADPSSGPSRPESRKVPSTHHTNIGGVDAQMNNGQKLKPEFCLDGMQGKYIAFGGGPSMCPGRNFAKRATIAAISMLTSRFDLELLNGSGDVKLDSLRYYGMGSPRPAGAVPFRIRRRQSEVKG